MSKADFCNIVSQEDLLSLQLSWLTDVDDFHSSYVKKSFWDPSFSPKCLIKWCINIANNHDFTCSLFRFSFPNSIFVFVTDQQSFSCHVENATNWGCYHQQIIKPHIVIKPASMVMIILTIVINQDSFLRRATSTVGICLWAAQIPQVKLLWW